MIVKSATGDVDLSRPENIRRGMVFGLPDGAFCVERYEPSVDAYRSTAGKMLAARALCDGLFVKFLGCDPAYATRVDCERFGIALSVDAGAHGFARTREGFAVDLRREALPGLVVLSGDKRRGLRREALLYDHERFVGLDMRHASAEDVERLCCGEPASDTAAADNRARHPGFIPPPWPRCSLTIGDHAEHEDIAAGVTWAAKVVPPDASKWTPAPSAQDIAAWRERAATLGTAESVQLRSMAQSAARETTMKLGHGEATDKGDHFWYIGTCGAAVTSETIPEIVRLATERGKPVKADVNGVAVTAYPGCHVEGLAQAWLAALDGKADVVASTWWTDVNFLCPECASINQWGSSRQADGTLRRHCHGHLVQPDGSGKACRFSWPEAEDAGRLKNRERGGDYLVIGGGAPPTSPVYAVDSPEDAARIFGKGSEMAGKARESLVSTWVDAPIWPTSHTLTIRAADIPASIVNLTPQAAALRAALSTVDTLQWSAADKRALRDAAHAVCEMIEATDGKAPAGLRGPVTEALAALASAAHVGPAIIGEAVKARDAARVVMARRK